MPGPAERELDRASRLLASSVAALISVIAGALALTVVPPDRLGHAALAVVLLALWRVVYVAGFLNGATWPSRTAQSLLWIDVLVTSVLALCQNWVDVPYLVADSAGWVQTLVVVTAVSHPWLARWRAGLAMAAVLAVSFGVGAAFAVGPGLTSVILPAIWVLGNAALSGLTTELVRGAARRADEATARRERALADLEVSRARRTAEREHLADLHDTAAATLLMVGMGTVADSDHWLTEQAGRDLLVLAGSDPASGSDDLVRLLDDVTATSGVDVTLHCAEQELILPAEVAAAFAGATGEALRNVRRHAGVNEAVVTVERAGPGARLLVADAGRGLPASGANASARGVQHSIVGRLERVGGRAAVESGAPGGVLVRMEWPDE